MLKVNYLITEQNITVNYNGETHTISRAEDGAEALIEAIRAKNFDDIPSLVSKAKTIETFSQGAFTVKDGVIFVNGAAVPIELGNKILKFAKEKLPHEPLVRFAERINKNPSYRSVNQLFQFLENNDHPITEDGKFIAYKKVRNDFKDCHTGTFDNSVGNVVEMPRNQVNEDPNQTCSNGLHVANFSYAKDFYGDGIMLEVEVDPADVVAVPVDYASAKMRVCRYTVIGVVSNPLTGQLKRIYTPCNDRYNDDDYYDVDIDYEDNCEDDCEYDDDDDYEDGECNCV